MNDPDHPIWRLFQAALYIGAAYVFLQMNASKFDITEVKTLMELGLVILVGEAVKYKSKGAKAVEVIDNLIKDESDESTRSGSDV